MYSATVLLLRTERQFWKMTPRKLNALVKAHIEINNGNDEDKPGGQKQEAFIDQLI